MDIGSRVISLQKPDAALSLADEFVDDLPCGEDNREKEDAPEKQAAGELPVQHDGHQQGEDQYDGNHEQGLAEERNQTSVEGSSVRQ
ncbi:hypothetical protein D3C76_1196140 [compost metagenome]